jgi:hypothetical protein
MNKIRTSAFFLYVFHPPVSRVRGEPDPSPKYGRRPVAPKRRSCRTNAFVKEAGRPNRWTWPAHSIFAGGSMGSHIPRRAYRRSPRTTPSAPCRTYLGIRAPLQGAGYLLQWSTCSLRRTAASTLPYRDFAKARRIDAPGATPYSGGGVQSFGGVWPDSLTFPVTKKRLEDGPRPLENGKIPKAGSCAQPIRTIKYLQSQCLPTGPRPEKRCGPR